MKQNHNCKKLLGLIMIGALLFITACSQIPPTIPEQSSPTLSFSVPPDDSAGVTLIPFDAIPERYFHTDRTQLTMVDLNLQVEGASYWEYTDEAEFTYYYDKESYEQIGFAAPSMGLLTPKSISLEDMKTVADAIASRYIDTTDYHSSYHFQEDTGIHYFNYMRKIHGYPTEDLGSVRISDSGYLSLVRFVNRNLFDTVEIPSFIDEKALDARFYEAVEERGITVTKIEKRELVVENGNLHMKYHYDYVVDETNEIIALEELSIRIT